MGKAYLVLVDGQGVTLNELMHPLFGDERLARIQRHQTPHMRIDSACAALACLVAQKMAFGRIQRNLYYYGKNGKPYFADENSGWLSLTHAAAVGACLIAPVMCGCDVEDLKRDLSRMEEKVRFRQQPEAENTLAIWCVKESYVKLTGEGLKRPFSGLQFSGRAILDEAGKHLAWANTGKIGRVQWAAALEREEDLSVILMTAEEAINEINTCALPG